MQNKNVYVIGTCRAFDIARIAHYNGKINVLNRGDVFVHSTKEILNIIDYSVRKNIPKELKKYLTIDSSKLPLIKQADAFIIEISSKKCIKYQENYFKSNGTKIPNYQKYIYKIPNSEIIKDVRGIIRKLNKEIIFVSHINIVNNSGPLIESRNDLSVLTEKIANNNNSYFFNPSDYLTEKDIGVYVDKPIYHYTTEGKKYMGDKFTEYLKSIKW